MDYNIFSSRRVSGTTHGICTGFFITHGNSTDDSDTERFDHLVKDNDILTIWSNTCDSDINLESALAGEIWELKKEVISDFPSNSVLNVGLGAMGATRGN